MKGIKTLIKLRQRELDEQRRIMVSLENQKEQLKNASAKLQQELEQEIALAGQQPDMAHFFGDFAKRIQNRQQEITNEIATLDQAIAKVADQIAEAFAELKKIEIALENAKKREAESQARKETIALDEIAEQQHRKKSKETI